MSKQQQVQAPTSAAGLVRYFDISGGGVEITPEMVAAVAVGFIVIEVAVWLIL